MSIKKYQPQEIEAKWQKSWKDLDLYSTYIDKDKKFYALAEFAYPSGDLHIGHWFTFCGADIYARYKRMQGYSVFFPNGFDAFGLPAENAAIKRSIHPLDWTMANIDKMKIQFESMGASFSFDHQVVTCTPEFYKWNQWIFLKMFEKGVAYRGKYLSNWCPNCQTVLANEGVEAGLCWRCGTQVVQKEVDQWFFKITQYADRLLWKDRASEDQQRVDWPLSVRQAQNDWIGKSQGVEVEFKIENQESGIKVFTTRVDTIFGATFLVIAPEHPLIGQILASEFNIPGSVKDSVKEYIDKASKKSELARKENKEKTGQFTGIYAINPLNEAKIPVWVADYVLTGYGTGAIMAVPAHDERDFEFAKKFNLEIKTVIEPVTGEKRDDEEFRKSIVALVRDPQTNKYLSVNWGQNLGGNLFIGGGLKDGEEIQKAALREIEEETGYKNLKLVSTTENIHHHYHAASKNVNREIEARGLYFELLNSERVEPVLESDEKDKFSLEWLTDTEVENKVSDSLHQYIFNKLIKGRVYTGMGILVNSGEFSSQDSKTAQINITKYLEEHHLGSAMVTYHLHDWSISRQRYWGTPIPIIHCPKCGMVPVSEAKLPVELPYDVDYTPKGKSPLASNESWLKVKCPNCSGEAQRDADTMDTFVDSSWYFFRFLDPKLDSAPFDKNLASKMMPVDIYFGGAEHTLGHTLYSRFFTKFFKDLGLTDLDEYALKRVNHGVVLGPDGNRMSKSKGNVVNPDEEVKKYGTDAVRTYLAFFMPYDGVGPWYSDRIWGTYRFLERVWGLSDKVLDVAMSDEDLFMLSKTIKKVGEDIEEVKFNTAVAALMEWLNHLTKKKTVSRTEYQTLILLLAPFAPHITEEIWSLSNSGSIHNQRWPEFDSKHLERSLINLVVQIDGKVRDQFTVEKNLISSQDEAVKLAKMRKNIQKYLENKSVKQVVYIPGRLINLVLEP